MLSSFERLAMDNLQERQGEGNNPFHGIDVVFARPTFVVWDLDNGIDLVVGSANGSPYFFEGPALDTLIGRMVQAAIPSMASLLRVFLGLPLWIGVQMDAWI